jgi:hypothetical protein
VPATREALGVDRTQAARCACYKDSRLGRHGISSPWIYSRVYCRAHSCHPRWRKLRAHCFELLCRTLRVTAARKLDCGSLTSSMSDCSRSVRDKANLARVPKDGLRRPEDRLTELDRAECWLLATASGASVGTPGGAPRFSAQVFVIDHQEIERDQDRRGLPFGRPQREEVAGRVWPKHHRLSIEHDTLLILDRHRSRHFVKSCQRASCHFVNSAPR